MNWHLSNRSDPRAVQIFDRHYSRQSPGAKNVAPPGSCLVFLTEEADALWVGSRPFAEYVRHDWAGAWMCNAFRNEAQDKYLSSALVTEAIAVMRHFWEPPPLGMVTFIDVGKTRKKRDPGRCFRKAGFNHVGYTKGGLVALQMLPEEMPEPAPPAISQPSLFETLG